MLPLSMMCWAVMAGVMMFQQRWIWFRSNGLPSVNCDSEFSDDCDKAGPVLANNWISYYDGQPYPFGFLQGQDPMLHDP